MESRRFSAGRRFFESRLSFERGNLVRGRIPLPRFSSSSVLPRSFSVSLLTCHPLLVPRRPARHSASRESARANVLSLSLSPPLRILPSRSLASLAISSENTGAASRCTVHTPTRCYESQFAGVRPRRCFPSAPRASSMLSMRSPSFSVPRSEDRESFRMSSRPRRFLKTSDAHNNLLVLYDVIAPALIVEHFCTRGGKHKRKYTKRKMIKYTQAFCY